MSNSINLNTEGFDQAAAMLARSMDNFNTDSFSESVLMFKQSVEKFQTLLGMQAENEHSLFIDRRPVYNERAFRDV